jgi:SAM-dependent methyltransferase
MAEHEQLRRSWIANAAAWCDAVRGQRIESRRLVTDAAIVQAILDQHPQRVPDLGCGEGWLARALASHGIHVTGVDGSEPLIEAARAQGGGEFVVASYEELWTAAAELPLALAAASPRPARAAALPPQSRTAFDLIAANFSLLDDRVEALLTALPRATLVIQTAHPAFAGGTYADGWRVETFDSFSGEWRESMPWYFRTLESWTGVLRASGYTIADIREPIHPERGVPASILFVCRA